MNKDTIPDVVERMALADVPAVAAMEKVVFSLPWSARAFEYELRYNPMAYFIVVRQRNPGSPRQADGVPWWRIRKANPASQPVLGYAGLWLIVDEGHICTLGVHPDWRRRHLGELLLVDLIEHAGAQGALVATLEVRTSNVVAQRLYRKYGFAIVGLRKGYYSDNREDALIMTTEPICTGSYQSRFSELKTVLYQELSKQLTSTAA